MSAPKRKVCERFEPQAWRKVLCKNCFKTQEDHNQQRLQQQAQTSQQEQQQETQQQAQQALTDDPNQKNIIRNCLSAPPLKPKLTHSISMDNVIGRLNSKPALSPTPFRRSVSPATAVTTLSPKTPITKAFSTETAPITAENVTTPKQTTASKTATTTTVSKTSIASKTSSLLAKFPNVSSTTASTAVVTKGTATTTTTGISASKDIPIKNSTTSKATALELTGDNKIGQSRDKSSARNESSHGAGTPDACVSNVGEGEEGRKQNTSSNQTKQPPININNKSNSNKMHSKLYKPPTAGDTQEINVSNSKVEGREEEGMGGERADGDEIAKVENTFGRLSGGDDGAYIENANANIKNDSNNINNNSANQSSLSSNNKHGCVYDSSGENLKDRSQNGGPDKQDSDCVGTPDLKRNFDQTNLSSANCENNSLINNLPGCNGKTLSNPNFENSGNLNATKTTFVSDTTTNSSSSVANNNNNFSQQSGHVEDFNRQNDSSEEYFNQTSNYPNYDHPNNLSQSNSSFNQPNIYNNNNNFNANYTPSCNNNQPNATGISHLGNVHPSPPAQFYYDGTHTGYIVSNNSDTHHQPTNSYNTGNFNNNNNTYNVNPNINNNYNYDQPTSGNGNNYGLTQKQLSENYFNNNDDDNNDDRLESFLKSQRLILEDPNFDLDNPPLHHNHLEGMSSYDYLRSDAILEGKRLLLESLRERNVNLEMSNQKLEREKMALNDLLTCKKKDYERMKEHLNAAINDLEVQVQRLHSEKTRLVDKLQLPESERCSLAAEENKIAELKRKLNEYEYRFEELESENEDLKQEIRDLQLEMAELHDQFREEETLEFRELQKELESAAKNCRILQFKMKKAERHSEQAESDKVALEEKLKRLETTSQGTDDRRKTRLLEDEIRLLKESNTRLHEEMAKLEEKRRKVAEELDRSKNTLNDTDSKRLCLQNEIDNMKHQINKLKDQLKYESRSESKTSIKGLHTTDASILNQLTKDLKDSIEREADIKEQLKFAEKECSIMHKKMTGLERENETLSLQVQKLTAAKTSRFLNKSKFEQIQEKESGMDKEGELALQAELAEQEVRSLKKSLEETQKENENLLCAIKYLRNKVEQREGSRCATPFGEPKGFKEEMEKLSGVSEEEVELKRSLEECRKELSAVKDKYELLLEETEASNQAKHTIQEKDKGGSVEMEQKWKSLQKDYEKVKNDCAIISKELTSILEQNSDLTKSLSELEKTLDENEKLKMDKEILSKEIDEHKARIKSLKEEKLLHEEKLSESSKSLENEKKLKKKVEELEGSLREKSMAWDRERGKIEREANVGCDIATKINKEVASFNESLQADKESLLKDKENLVKEKQRLAEERDAAVKEKEAVLKEKSQLEKSTKHQLQQLKDSKGFDDKQAAAEKSKLEKQLKEREARMNEMGLECEALSKQCDKEAAEKEKFEKEKEELQNELQALKEKFEKKLTKEKEKRRKSEAFLEESKGDTGLLAKLQKDLEEKEKLLEKLNKKLKKSEEKLEAALKGSSSNIPNMSESSGSLSRRSSRSDTQAEARGDPKETDVLAKESGKFISELKVLFEEEMEIWKTERETLKKYKENEESQKKKILKLEKDIEELKDKLRNESSEKQKLQVKVKLCELENKGDASLDAKKPLDDKKVSDFRNKFEKFGGVSKSFKRVSVPSALDVLSSPNNSSSIVKDLQKQIEDLEKKTQKERESLTKKNEKLKQELEKESNDFKEKNTMLEEKLSEISIRQKELIEKQLQFEQARLAWSESQAEKKSSNQTVIPSY